LQVVVQIMRKKLAVVIRPTVHFTPTIPYILQKTTESINTPFSVTESFATSED
jgi:hypothetical protein